MIRSIKYMGRERTLETQLLQNLSRIMNVVNVFWGMRGVDVTDVIQLFKKQPNFGH